jgi:nitrogen-specific signal transduction histidine kinase/CheY-like chemotaxis protein
LDTGVPRFDNTGAFVGYIGSCLDITEFKQQQDHIFAMQKLESLGVIAGGIAHDFNNLLSCILVDASNTASELEPGSPALSGLHRIEAVAERAAEIVRQIMDYAAQGRQQIEGIDLCRLVRDMLHLLHVCMPRNVRLDLRLPNELPHIQASAPQIRQVVMNLVLNAAESFKTTGGTIRVAASQRSIEGVQGIAEGDYICLEIADDGSGMTEEIRERIFDPFFTTKVAGRGWGLAAVQRIVRAHRGSVHVDSTVGVGTKFEILLPCFAPQIETVSTPAEMVADSAEAQNSAILIVEDEEALRISVSRVLRMRGFIVLEAADGRTAIELIRSRGSDIGVLLLDLVLPDNSNLEVLEWLEQIRPDARVILTSAFGWEAVNGRAEALRHDTFIRKPYEIHELISLIRNANPPPGEPNHGRRQSAGA